MHFVTLMKLNILPQEPNEALDKEVREKMKLLEEASDDGFAFMRNFHRERLYSFLSPFSRAIVGEVDRIMEPYNQQTEDPRFLEFDDRTEELENEYENGTPQCIKLPQGTICEAEFPLWGKFIIKDGKVFQCKAGPLKHEKRTKKAKKMKALMAYPRKKLYKSLEEYAVGYCGYQKGDKEGRFGWWLNPNGYWDWFSIGGRWPRMFLVKKECEEFTYGERTPEEVPAPDGYMWVCGARKKDIAWNEMLEWHRKVHTETYHKYVDIFESGVSPDPLLKIDEVGIFAWCEYLYKKGETLEDYLSRVSYSIDAKYAVIAHDLVSEDEWVSQYELEWDVQQGEADKRSKWNAKIEKFIDDMDDEDVIVVVDYHS